MRTHIASFLAHLAYRGSPEHTLRGYRHDLEALANLPELSRDTLRHALREHYGENVSARSRAVYVYRSFCNYLVRQGVLERNPAADICIPKTAQNLPRVLSVDEVFSLLAICQDDPRTSALLELLYGSGLRIAEAAALDAGDLDLARGQVTVRHGKGDKPRVALFGSPAAAAFRRYLRRRKSGPVFCGPHGRLSDRQLYRLVVDAGRRAGLRLHPHTLRHCFASHLTEAGCPVRELQELLGHASVSTTTRYTRAPLDYLQRVHRESHPHAGGAA